MVLYVSVKTVIRVLILGVVILGIANLLVNISTLFLGHDYIYGLVPLFDFYQESNIPTWYSSLLLFVAASLLGLISILSKEEKESDTIYWIGLTLLFLFLSLDEIAQLHELSGEIVGTIGRGSGMLYNIWVVNAGIGVAIFLVIYFRFWNSLPSTIKKLFFFSGVIYVGGALGLELVESYFYDIYRTINGVIALFIGLEEMMEMLGVILFIYSLMVYIRDLKRRNIELHFK